VQVLARCPVSHKQQILIVQVGRRLLVVGESAAGMNTLSEITDPDEVAVMMAQIGARANAVSAIASATPHAEEKACEIDEQNELSFARQQLNGLAEKVRVVARQLNRA
jgi:flagellar biogenesis protein FliO